MNISEVKTAILSKLEKELSPLLTYHNVEHTISVFNATKLICEAENINEKHSRLLLTAALFHDTGFLIQRENHEMFSCNIAKDYLPKYNYSSSDIEFICSIIMATMVHYRPKDIYEQIIKDADLDYLGTDDYDKISEQLFIELKNYNLISDNKKDWVQLQINFLKTHHYYTQTGQKLRESAKQKTLNLLSINSNV